MSLACVVFSLSLPLRMPDACFSQDTFVVGCAYSDKNVYPETFKGNPDFNDPIYSTENGIYQPGCGLDNVMLCVFLSCFLVGEAVGSRSFLSYSSWGHDEYLYQVLKDQSSLPEEALAMIRYHSFYPCVFILVVPLVKTVFLPCFLSSTFRWHREGAYAHLTDAKDRRLLAAVRAFNPYDLYSKSDAPPDAVALRPYYEGLIAKYFPEKLHWWISRKHVRTVLLCVM